ncbi:hypothetical protein C4K03_5418 [Pseudomonas synxantha]|uniref:Uncharacterized protein n=1 Tax=Pseudomonas synxantha TaxID=47883 RepID=A0A3G7UDP5_9PSED|nr:hypothetical protein C4K03_5418 [Pseudomonas synxantha]
MRQRSDAGGVTGNAPAFRMTVTAFLAESLAESSNDQDR